MVSFRGANIPCAKCVSFHTHQAEKSVTVGFTVHSRILNSQYGTFFTSFLLRLEFLGRARIYGKLEDSKFFDELVTWHNVKVNCDVCCFFESFEAQIFRQILGQHTILDHDSFLPHHHYHHHHHHHDTSPS